MSSWNAARRAARAIWNGPFFIGPLTRPVSVGDVLMKLFETAWRGLVCIIGALIVIGAAAIGWEQLSPKLFPPLRTKIEASVTYDDGSKPVIEVGPAGDTVRSKPFRCNLDQPLKLRFRNNSEKEVGHLTLEISARREGYSDNVINNGYQSVGIRIPAKRSWVGCWTPSFDETYNASELEYAVTVIDAR